VKHRAIALLSGGLDSTLAVRLMLGHGVEVHTPSSAALCPDCVTTVGEFGDPEDIC
jgi:asparagine synthetase B (glutamine-hydrolysing)